MEDKRVIGEGRVEKVKGLERGRKERTKSENSVLEMWAKRKRDGMGEEREERREEELIFKRSRLVVRSPEGEERKEGRGEKGGDWTGGEVVEKEGRGEIWKELEKTKKGMEAYMIKVNRMEKELEDWKRREEELRVEGEKMKRRMRELERKLEEKEIGEKGREEEKKGGEGVKSIEGRIKIIENSIEAKERVERRKRNCIIKGVKKEKGDWKWGVEKILREIDAEVKVEEMRRIYVGGEERGDMVWVKLEKEDDKRRLWSKKKILKGKSIWIEEDLTRREREVRRRLGLMANEERRKGKSAWVEGDRIRLGEE